MTDEAKHFRWEEQRVDHLRGGITRRLVTSDKAMIGEVRFEKGATVPLHSHEHEQFTHVVEGALCVTLGDEGDQKTMIVRAGEVILIPSHMPHAVEALEATLEYDVFTPPRLDWLDPDSQFLRADANTNG
ncbi:cupin domain-containing protein [Hoeflea sp. G2-23]|uniref:Cupin domain-containing protein n=1 Tax=Hoeflea algicola TaxID=2983763 RepID=A0ABT3ZBW5_9HYPH|nr:cupin domain-containing protein [Hoeflea algicola]MCY0149260.1 cupin domain-containing protein [Hoeflea algicola]